MAGLIGKTVSQSYKSLLRVDDDANGVTTTGKTITDGEGTETCVKISDDRLQILPKDDDNTSALAVRDTSGDYILRVDTTDNVVKVNGNQDYANTQYAYFGATIAETSGFAVNVHQAIPFGNGLYANNAADNTPDFGTGTDPATTYSTLEGTSVRASDLVPMMWYVPDNITIDSVSSLEGADTATGDTTRMHLFSYTFSSGSTSALSSGLLVANSSDQVNAGSEQSYLNTWTVDSSNKNVDSGKVILAFFRSDSINSDYSISIIVKYHLR